MPIFRNKIKYVLNCGGEVIDIMCEFNPKHLRRVFIENGEKVLYLQNLQEIYITSFD